MSPTRPVRFGALLRQADNRWTTIAESARIADDLGFHSIHFIDHLLAIPDAAGDILESWTTMTACAALTRRVRVGGNVLCNSFRSPALLAKMSATLDVISGGRFELGIGAGWHEAEYRAYGFCASTSWRRRSASSSDCGPASGWTSRAGTTA
jgi:alkanesulfonate monooxygenase SsuD/methylene tetrahydromethanopterin reductase-like flavin-dependent oxidoreductase (luciferase family)